MLNLEKYYVNNGINIPKDEWNWLKENFSEKEIIEALNNLVNKYNISFPYRKISLEDSIKDYNRLVNFDSKTIIKTEEFKMKFDYKYPISNIYFKRTTIGKNASNYFTQEERHKVGSHNKSSLYDSWYNQKLRDKTFHALFTMKRPHVNNSTIVQTMEVKHYLPSAFRPTVAKAIYDMFDAQKILDMSAGWGDRLVASCGREYKGFDPNTKLKDIYNKIIKIHNLNASVEILPFEDSILEEDYYDIMFSSPPYFKCEKYSDEETQSSIRYKDLNSWLNNFLLTSINKIHKALKKDGTLAINISDVNIKGKRQYICDDMNDYIKSLNMKYIGCYGLQLSKLPNTQEKSDIAFCEPIWIWKK